MNAAVPGGRRSDTRQRIQQVALELFAEQGYEATSLREIAERLSVTKAALYYHFKSKEDIVNSFTEDYFAQLDELIAWGREQPRSAHTAHELLERYIGIVMEGSEVFRFLHRNQAMAHSVQDGKPHRFEQFRPKMIVLLELIAGPDAPARSRVRATAALFGVSASCMFFMPDSLGPDAGTKDVSPEFEPISDREELRKIVLELADDLTSDITPGLLLPAAPRGTSWTVSRSPGCSRRPGASP
jgi:AcrR family transcriptional regulator